MTINLHCPSLAKTVPVVAREEQNLDLGSIARSFGLDPWSLKLNGHFISRGMDLISSSVTWRSLFSFFSAKGLSTGTDDRDVLIVDGKLLKSGTKSKHTNSSISRTKSRNSISSVAKDRAVTYYDCHRVSAQGGTTKLDNLLLLPRKAFAEDGSSMTSNSSNLPS